MVMPIAGEILCTNSQDSSPQTCLQVKGIYSIPQLRLSSQVILSGGKLRFKTNQHSANPTYMVKFLGSKDQAQNARVLTFPALTMVAW